MDMSYPFKEATRGNRSVFLTRVLGLRSSVAPIGDGLHSVTFYLLWREALRVSTYSKHIL